MLVAWSGRTFHRLNSGRHHDFFTFFDSSQRPTHRPSQTTCNCIKKDGSAEDNDRVEIGPTPLAFAEWERLGLEPPHLPTLRTYRLQRLVDQLVARDLGGILLFDPLNIRYATDTTNMQLWTTHNPARACFVAASGHVVLWDFHGCDHLSAHLPLVTELRSGASFSFSRPVSTPTDTPDISPRKSTSCCANTPVSIVGLRWIESKSPACAPWMHWRSKFAAARK
ncbi:hypothetical protein QZH47_10135 [Pseudomonas corrugata]